MTLSSFASPPSSNGPSRKDRTSAAASSAAWTTDGSGRRSLPFDKTDPVEQGAWRGRCLVEEIDRDLRRDGSFLPTRNAEARPNTMIYTAQATEPVGAVPTETAGGFADRHHSGERTALDWPYAMVDDSPCKIGRHALHIIADSLQPQRDGWRSPSTHAKIFAVLADAGQRDAANPRLGVQMEQDMLCAGREPCPRCFNRHPSGKHVPSGQVLAVGA